MATQPVAPNLYIQLTLTRGSLMPSANNPRVRMKGDKLAHRLSHILAVLHQGEAVDKHELARRFEVDIRTIDRDLGERLCGIAERNGDGLWQLARSARSTIPAKYLHDYAQMIGAMHVLPDSSLSYVLEQLETPEPRRTLRVQPMPQEDLRERSHLFRQLQACIERRNECRYTYKGRPRTAEPYRLTQKNGVWYLAAEEGGRLKNFSVALIENLQVDEDRQFTPKTEHQSYINGKDDVWFTEATTEVLLRVAPSIAHYFARRSLLPQQQQRKDEDGSLLVTTQINHVNQLLPVVRYWLPHVRIISPICWQQELETQLRTYLTLSMA